MMLISYCTEWQLWNLFMNAAAKARFDSELNSAKNCKIGYADIFPSFVITATEKPIPTERRPLPLTWKIKNGRVFSVIRNTIDWTDGKPATSYIVRDVDDERSAKLKMYNLAYIWSTDRNRT